MEFCLPRAKRMSQTEHDYDMSCPCPWCFMQRRWLSHPDRPARGDL